MRDILEGFIVCLPVIFIAVCTIGLLHISGGDDDESHRTK